MSELCPARQVAELCEAANKEVGAENGVRIANFLCPGNYAVSGGTAGCEAVEKLAKSFGARMSVRLAVAGAFHTDYMKPAEEALRCVCGFDSVPGILLFF
jgi:[acyl-carrier-protein] S-malonyltransferase